VTFSAYVYFLFVSIVQASYCLRCS